MSNDEQPSTSEVGDSVRGWVKAARAVLEARAKVAAEAEEVSVGLRRRTVQARRGHQVLWHFIPLFPDDDGFVRKIASRACLPPVSPDVQRELDRLTTEVAQAVADLRKVTGFGKLLLFGGTRDKANQAAQFLADYRRWFLASRLGDEIERAAPRDDRRVRALRISDALADWVGFARDLPDEGKTAAIEAASSFAKLPNSVAIIQRAAADEANLA